MTPFSREVSFVAGKMMDAIRLAAGLVAVLICLLGARPAYAQAVQGYETVEIPVAGDRAATIKAYLRRPISPSAAPVVVGLHGCGGLLTASGRLSAREAAWAETLVSDGYAVLFPDSFNPRGYRQICTFAPADRPIRPHHRVNDSSAVVAWLASQSFADASRIALLGWSHGGSTTLLAVDGNRRPAIVPAPRIAIAFYPGCRQPLERDDYAPAIPLTILIGSADDWTPPAPCRALAAKFPIRLIEYPEAVHAFDSPNSARRTRTDVTAPVAGQVGVQVGTDPVARAAAFKEVRAILAKAFSPAAR